MSSRRRKTYDAVLSNPVRANISWNDVVTLAVAFGALIVAGTGSMFSFELNGASSVLHWSHPGNELSKPGVRAFRKFLEEAGVDPDDL